MIQYTTISAGPLIGQKSNTVNLWLSSKDISFPGNYEQIIFVKFDPARVITHNLVSANNCRYIWKHHQVVLFHEGPLWHLTQSFSSRSWKHWNKPVKCSDPKWDDAAGEHQGQSVTLQRCAAFSSQWTEERKGGCAYLPALAGSTTEGTTEGCIQLRTEPSWEEMGSSLRLVTGPLGWMLSWMPNIFTFTGLSFSEVSWKQGIWGRDLQSLCGESECLRRVLSSCCGYELFIILAGSARDVGKWSGAAQNQSALDSVSALDGCSPARGDEEWSPAINAADKCSLTVYQGLAKCFTSLLSLIHNATGWMDAFNICFEGCLWASVFTTRVLPYVK